METEIKTQSQTVVESAPIRVTISEKGYVYASFNLPALNTAEDLRIAARTLTHAAILLDAQNSNSQNNS